MPFVLYSRNSQSNIQTCGIVKIGQKFLFLDKTIDLGVFEMYLHIKS